MNIHLKTMYYLQFFIWGSWLTSLGVYLDRTLHFDGSQIASVFATMGIAAIIMPPLMGVIADKWVNAERLLSVCHIIGGIFLFLQTYITSFSSFFWIMLLYNMMYMPTLSLASSLSYNTLKNKELDVVTDFPPIRIWGTIGFISAMWLVDLCGWTSMKYQLHLAAVFSVACGLFALTLPKYMPIKSLEKTSIRSFLGIDALQLLKNYRMSLFFLFSMLIGAALQITNTFGQPFLSDFANNPLYKDSFTIKHPGILTSISQISEALFILAIPFFLKRFGIKTVMLMSIVGWFFRFGLFGISNPNENFIFLILSMIVYGMAFDFFNVSGSLFIEQETSPQIRASAQGMFIFMINGVGTIIGTKGSGWVVDYFTDQDGIRNWQMIWFSFALYSLILAILFAFLFRVKKTKL